MKSHLRRRSADGQGFTLIELLVVVAIIAVLVAILLPAMASARSTAIQLSCAGRMKQMGLAMQMYLNEHQETFAPYRYDTATVAGLYWGDLMKPYLNDANPNEGLDGSPCGDAFFCPTMGPAWEQYGLKRSTKYMGFAYNDFGLGGSMWGNSVRLGQIQSPDRILCFAEAYEYAFWWPASPTWSTNRFGAGELFHFRHRLGDNQLFPGDGSMNAYYIDGHIASIRSGELGVGWDNFYMKYPYMEAGW
jgi:prepilin-type N-terminal cleavage/methylation domain-containing protein